MGLKVYGSIFPKKEAISPFYSEEGGCVRWEGPKHRINHIVRVISVPDKGRTHSNEESAPSSSGERTSNAVGVSSVATVSLESRLYYVGRVVDNPGAHSS